MEQCWDADPLKRPDISSLYSKIDKINLYYLNKSNEPIQSKVNKKFEVNKISSLETNYTSSRLFTSKVHQFENMPEPKNATEGNFITYYH